MTAPREVSGKKEGIVLWIYVSGEVLWWIMRNNGC